MELGEKLLQARQELGLSQRQLCADVITRNMLSRLEHGTAKPSMDTLLYLADRLGKPVSYFMEEEGTVSRNQRVITLCRSAFDRGDYANALSALSDYRAPDPVYDMERGLWGCLSLLALAENALNRNQQTLARTLLEEAAFWESELWFLPEISHRRLRMLGQLRGQNLREICDRLPSLDRDLMLRARAELEAGNPQRAGQLLDAAQERVHPWHLWRGRAYYALKLYPPAVACLKQAEKEAPEEACPLLERCYRELGDYKNAYEYACKLRPQEP